ncbi:MAG: tRNA lysidine(34) synthetase TilS [Candidatus Cloacimonetes bacterium]|nr:tRNA lysidine(34) synthetase TilS [Candidatus Cloacimonadota bacterium]
MKKEIDFLVKFEDYIEEQRLFKPKSRILVGFSGGADSTALLTALFHLRTKYQFHLLAVHINYHLRGENSDLEEKAIVKFCFSRNIAVLVEHFDPAGEKVNENNLRQFRFNCFRRICQSYKIDMIALGHNRSDQAETVLYRLLRGSLLTGLAGIRVRNGMVTHPLLPFSRHEIVSYLEAENLKWCEDISNQENEFTRNKLRNVAIPWISEHINPRVIEKISAAAPLLQEADEILCSSALMRMRSVLEDNNEEAFILNIPELLKIRSLLRFYIYRHLFGEIAGSEQDFYQSNFEVIEEALQRKGNRQIQLPHKVYLEKVYDNLKFYKQGIIEQKEPDSPHEIPSLRSRFAYDGWRISMKKLKKLPVDRDLFVDKNIAYLDFDKLVFPLIVRHREAGDRFVPFGMKHSKKLKDFFIDLKVPVPERKQNLVFTDQEQIFWVGSQRIDQRYAVSEETVNILMIKIEKIRQRKARAAERMKRR